jgi:manganese/zinc/iron transport system permease protein
MSYHNPYSGNNLIEFFFTLFIRFFEFITGNIKFQNLSADEIQIIVLVGVSASSAMVGTFLVLRKMTMLANSLSHTILLGIVIAFLMTKNSVLPNGEGYVEPINIQAMMLASLVMGILTTFLTEFLTKTVRLQEDASTGLVFTTLFALGIILVTLLTRNAHIGTEVVMGNVDALHLDDCKFIFIILLVNSLLFFMFFKEFKITTFDSGLSKALGISTIFYNYLLMIQVSLTTIGAFRAVGVLMVLSFIIGPPLIARFLTNHLGKMFGLSILIGSFCSIVGVAISRHILSVYGVALSTSGIVVTTILTFFTISCIVKLILQYMKMNFRGLHNRSIR